MVSRAKQANRSAVNVKNGRCAQIAHTTTGQFTPAAAVILAIVVYDGNKPKRKRPANQPTPNPLSSSARTAFFNIY
ncbi:MAG: hypothetical protein AAB666_00460 [Patescibacteria group bacterium]